jgi:hypothetical protein
MHKSRMILINYNRFKGMSFIDFVVAIRKKYMNWVQGVTDPGYYILKIKTNPLSPEETEFVEIYENTFALHSTSILATIPGTIYFYHYYRALKKQPLDEKRIKWARRGVMAFSPLAIALVFTAWTYERVSGFEPKLKEI